MKCASSRSIYDVYVMMPNTVKPVLICLHWDKDNVRCKTAARTDIFKDSFIPKTLKDWNQLDPNILQKSTSDKDPTSTFAELG
jgi:hypothetical protein